MGMYTEFNAALCFKKNTPSSVIEIIECLLGDKEWPEKLPEHDFFKSSRFRMVLTCDSYYFPSISDSKMEQDRIDHRYHLNIRCNLKNYDDEIEKFLDFISTHIETEGFLGYMRHEEFENPTLIYCEDGKIRFRYVG